MSEKPASRIDAPVQPPEPAGGSGYSLLAWIGFILLVAYPLSIGPAALIHQKSPPLRPFIEGAYKPITVLADKSNVVRNCLTWYIRAIWRVS